MRRNYSQGDIGKLIIQGRKKADYINKIIDDDIHLNMVSESNQPFKEKTKYIRNNDNMNKKQNLYWVNNSQRKIFNHFNNNQNYRYYQNENKNIAIDENIYYHANNENRFNNSLIFNKPIYSQKKLFPSLKNRGNYLNCKNYNIPYTDRLRLIKNQNYHKENNKYNEDDNLYNNDIEDYYKKRSRYNANNRNDNFSNREEFKSYEYTPNINYRIQNLKRNDSMLNLSTNLPKLNIRNKLINERVPELEAEEPNYEGRNYFSRNEKHYNPKRYDYEGSRFGDDTYNFFLNEPMRGDVKSVWKFPPVYCYNSRIDYGKSFPNY